MGSKRAWITAALLATAAIAAPVLSQSAPESLLPPGFGDPVPPPSPTPSAQPSAPPRARGPQDLLPPSAGPTPVAPPPVTLTEAEGEGSDDELGNVADAQVVVPEVYDLPPVLRRSTAAVGVISPAEGGFGRDAFTGSDGRMLVTLLDRLDAPLPSRWTSIVLRRALLGESTTPAGVDGADWVAARAWLLLRMGEADAARMLVQSVDTDRFTPRLYSVAMQSSLAIGDPAGMCRIAEPGERYSSKPAWPLARAMCSAMAGESGPAAAIIEAIRRRGRARGVDLTLAEKVVGAGANSRRSTTIEWAGIDRMTTWRYGLASAVAVDIPQNLMATMPLHARAWQVRAPMLAPAARAAPGDLAATLGVLSSAALVDLYGSVGDAMDSSELSGSLPDLLRLAYSDDTAGRVSALRSIWDGSTDPNTRFARHILTARAAARIPVDAAYAGEAADLIGSMLTAGLDVQAARWGATVDAMSAADADAAWAMLAVGTPRPTVRVDAARVNAFAGRAEGSPRAQLLFAGLAALGRLPQGDIDRLSRDLGVPLNATDRWTRAIVDAANAGRGGTVAVLAAVGMQTGRWERVPAQHLYHIVAALRRVGREPEARMIAAEAMMRT
ncbi:hypothetical protein [Sphingomonas sanxanigenens]|uniref:Uncharacterized protein n=1 Tax=Sphingomonas sanxanigenens DSM 19645 = NX02 TaxID=1123269 RepID=W0AC39_9SPHN|nr:hypothetical protein [Sphingomonas sanxanigenens]AHE53878.1 hypothetical protein NX02_10815 [Sphingomonas sanxanigenens DSM 19645 = NX02]